MKEKGFAHIVLLIIIILSLVGISSYTFLKDKDLDNKNNEIILNDEENIAKDDSMNNDSEDIETNENANREYVRPERIQIELQTTLYGITKKDYELIIQDSKRALVNFTKGELLNKEKRRFGTGIQSDELLVYNGNVCMVHPYWCGSVSYENETEECKKKYPDYETSEYYKVDDCCEYLLYDISHTIWCASGLDENLSFEENTKVGEDLLKKYGIQVDDRAIRKSDGATFFYYDIQESYWKDIN